MKHTLFTGTILLTLSGLFCRLIGFIYRIFLSHTIGAEGMGLFQLILPLYNLCLALSAFGVQTALSRLIAASIAKNDRQKAVTTFLTGTLLAFTISLCLSFLLRANASWAGTQMLHETRCIDFILVMSLALPFSALHTCINGWFYGTNNIQVPAVLQIVEELLRLGSAYLLSILLSRNSDAVTPLIAVFSLLIAECVSALLSYFMLIRQKSLSKTRLFFRTLIPCTKEICKTGIPLTMNRILLNLLHSVEAVLIPACLKQHTLSSASALSSFGIVTGMSLPLVLFPTALINAMSTILIPAISAREANSHLSSIRHLIKKTSLYSVSIGVFFTWFFFLWGNSLGNLFFQNQEAGLYIKMLSFICPFLFINITLASVMNGLGKAHLCFLVNLINMILRITCIYFLVPVLGIPGYLIGLVGAEAFCTIVSITIIRRIEHQLRLIQQFTVTNQENGIIMKKA